MKGYVKLAIRAYRNMARYKRKAEEAELELKMWLERVSDEDLSVYISETDKIQRIEDEKLEAFIRRHLK